MGPVRLGRARPLARNQWGGLPPVGERPIDNRRRYLYEVVGVFGAWLVIWAAYRWAREASGADDTVLGPILSILAPVVVSFSLPYIWWRYRRRERGIPFLVTRRNTFSSILVACIAVAVFFVFFFVSYPVLIALMGVEVEGDLTFWADWRAHGGAWLLATTLFYMVIVGPVEELFHRGFVQDQINRVYAPWLGILVASTVFVLGHVPIDFMVYKIEFAGWGLRWLSSFPFAVAMGLFYHWSRNIWGVAVYHGLYDLFLSLSRVEFGAAGPELTYGGWYLMYAVWFLGELLIILVFSYAAYRILWKRDRPMGSLGFWVRGVSDARPGPGIVARVHSLLASRRLVDLARRVDRSRGHTREVLSLALIGLLILGNLGISGALGVVPVFDDGGGNGPGPGPKGRLVTLPLEAEHAYVYEGTTEDYAFQQGDPRWYAYVNVTLTWVDEAPPLRFSNEPDTLHLEVYVDDGEELVLLGQDRASGNDVAGGAVTVNWFSDVRVRGEAILVSVTAVECGDMVPFVSIGGLRDRADNGNSFDLVAELTVVDEG